MVFGGHNYFNSTYPEFAKFPPETKLPIVKVPWNGQADKKSKGRKSELTI